MAVLSRLIPLALVCVIITALYSLYTQVTWIGLSTTIPSGAVNTPLGQKYASIREYTAPKVIEQAQALISSFINPHLEDSELDKSEADAVNGLQASTRTGDPVADPNSDEHINDPATTDEQGEDNNDERAILNQIEKVADVVPPPTTADLVEQESKTSKEDNEQLLRPGEVGIEQHEELASSQEGSLNTPSESPEEVDWTEEEQEQEQEQDQEVSENASPHNEEESEVEGSPMEDVAEEDTSPELRPFMWRLAHKTLITKERLSAAIPHRSGFFYFFRVGRLGVAVRSAMSHNSEVIDRLEADTYFVAPRLVTSKTGDQWVEVGPSRYICTKLNGQVAIQSANLLLKLSPVTNVNTRAWELLEDCDDAAAAASVETNGLDCTQRNEVRKELQRIIVEYKVVQYSDGATFKDAEEAEIVKLFDNVFNCAEAPGNCMGQR